LQRLALTLTVNLGTVSTGQTITAQAYRDGGGRGEANRKGKKSGKHFASKYDVKFGPFSGKYHVKIGHFVNFSYTNFASKNVLPPNLSDLLRLRVKDQRVIVMILLLCYCTQV